MFQFGKGLLAVLCMVAFIGNLSGCGGNKVETDPKALADEAVKLDKKAADGEKGL